MSKFEVGSILYLIPEGKFIVIPSQVIEEVTRKSIGGETTDYHVSFPGDERTMLLREFSGDIFEDISSVTEYLLNIAKEKVGEIVSSAEKAASENFEVVVSKKTLPRKTRRKSSSKKKESKKPEIENVAQVDLGNGQVANIKMSEELKGMFPT